MNGLLDVYRREAAIQASRGRSPLTLVVTSYNPNLPAVKGTLQPYGIESGWMPLASPFVGSGFGIAIGPAIGDQLHVVFMHGDTNSPRATYRITSNSDQPPVAQAGEIVIQAAQGQTIKMTADGKLSIVANGDTTVSITGKLNLTSTGKLSLTGSEVDVSGNLVVTGAITATQGITAGQGGGDQVTLQHHLHSGITIGGSSTPAPTAGT